MWTAIIKRYWQVALFRETPANTPYSLLLLGTVVFFYYSLVVTQWALADVDQFFTLGTSLLAGGSLIISYALYTYFLLKASRVSSRFIQTLTCLVAGHAIVHVVAFPLLIIAPLLAETKIAQPLALLIGVVYLILTLILTVWQFMVTVHIYKHALEIDYFPAVLASIGLLAFNILIVSFWR